MKVDWIFFDVGSTLVDESAAYDHRVREMIEETDITFSVFDCKRIELAKMGFDGNSEAIKYFGLRKTPWYSDGEVPYDDARITLKALKKQGYRLGVIANQVSGLKLRLQAWGLLEYFDVVVSSADFGIAKPDRSIFEKAFELAGCQPHNSVMVGDRIDNDIIPAKALGMKTVWIRTGLAAYQSVDLCKDSADWIIHRLFDLNEIFG